MNENLFAVLQSNFPSDSDNSRFAWLHDGRHYSYGDVDQVTARFAVTLTEMGVKPGDRIAVQVDKSMEALMLIMATMRMGAVILPLNSAYTPAEMAYFINDAEPALVVCDPGRADQLRPIAEKADARLETLGIWTSPEVSAGSFLNAVPEATGGFQTFESAGDDLAAIIYTSGTTGRSKGAVISHHNLVSNARVLVDYWHFTADDVLLHALPIYHTHGLFVASNVSLMAGASMIFLPKFDQDQMLEWLPRATTMMGVPTFYTRLLADDRFSPEATRHMRLFISGSAPLLAETHVRFEERTGHRILERYGMTETNMNTSNPYDGDRRAGTVGFPLPGTDLRIVDPDTGDALPDGEIGMIEVRGPNVFSGYWRMPKKTAEEFQGDGFFITGDLGRIDTDGYVTIVGRGKDLIISGGFNVYPKEVESAIDGLSGIVESAVFGVPHPDFGEGVCAAVVCEADCDLTGEQITGTLAETMAKFKQPRHIEFLDELPRNIMGKVQKNVLRDRFAGLFSA